MRAWPLPGLSRFPFPDLGFMNSASQCWKKERDEKEGDVAASLHGEALDAYT